MNRMLQIAFCTTFLLASLSACLQGAEETTPLTDAVVFLNFAADEEVISQGDFHCGEALEGIDRDVSTARWGRRSRVCYARRICDCHRRVKREFTRYQRAGNNLWRSGEML